MLPALYIIEQEVFIRCDGNDSNAPMLVAQLEERIFRLFLRHRQITLRGDDEFYRLLAA